VTGGFSPDDPHDRFVSSIKSIYHFWRWDCLAYRSFRNCLFPPKCVAPPHSLPVRVCEELISIIKHKMQQPSSPVAASRCTRVRADMKRAFPGALHNPATNSRPSVCLAPSSRSGRTSARTVLSTRTSPSGRSPRSGCSSWSPTTTLRAAS